MNPVYGWLLLAAVLAVPVLAVWSAHIPWLAALTGAAPLGCCGRHRPGCCDPVDCGPCCPDCPTCPTLNPIGGDQR